MSYGIKQCSKCPLYQGMPFGPILGGGYTPLFILVDNPSINDASVDELLSDHLGRLLKKILKESEIESYYITSLLKCHSSILKTSYVKLCKDWLIQELDTIKPKCLLILGKSIIKHINKYNLIIDIVPTLSLKEVYRGGKQDYDNIVKDFKLAKDLSLGIQR